MPDPNGPTPAVFRKRNIRELERRFAKQWSRFRAARRRMVRKPSPGAVHGLRLAARRLLAWHDLLGWALDPKIDARNRDALKKQLGIMGELRDSQVQRATVKPLRETLPAAAAFLKWLRRGEERLTRKARKKQRATDGAAWKRREKAAGKAAHKAFRKLGPEATACRLLETIGEAYSAAKLLKDRATPAEVKTIHKARIAFKRFRYMVEAAGRKLAGFTPGFLDDLRDYQGLMGRIQDVTTLQARFERFARRYDGDTAAAGAFRQALTAERDRCVAHYFQAAARLDQFWPAPARHNSGENV